MGTTNPGKEEPPEKQGDSGGQEAGKWRSWNQPNNSKDWNQGQEWKEPASSSENAGCLQSPAVAEQKEAPPRRDQPFQMPSRGGAQAPAAQQRGWEIRLKPGQLDGSRPPMGDDLRSDEGEQRPQEVQDPWKQWSKPEVQEAPARK